MNPIQLIKDLTKCVEQLMPGAGATTADIGLLNDTLIAADRFIENPNEDWEQAGECAVDAGMIMIGDPCYSYGPDPENAFLDHDKMWEFLTNGEKDWTKANFFSEDQFKQIPFQMGHDGCAVVMSSGFGDGCYPVFVRKVDTGDEEHGPDIRIAEARIIFFEDGEQL